MNFFQRMSAERGGQSKGGRAAAFPHPRTASRSTTGSLLPHQRTVTTGQDRIRTTDVGGGQSQALMQRPAPIQQKQQVKQKQADAAQKQGVISMEEGTSFSSYGTNST
jgi:hypothetical protein